ncbi:MAG TPA: acetate--CoA ligase family protein [Acidimicrobiales bacterium]|nr:acetate--CoA ligase family protein [Acidimicrobiales bacterium]
MVQQRSDLEEFFHPRAVAIVGSVNRRARPEQLRAAYSERWGDRWFLVNARGGQVGDIPVYRHVTDIPCEVTLAVINVGTALVAGALEECGKHGVRYAIVFSAGFSEVGPEGAARERELGELARRYGMRVFGPNTNTNAFEVLPEPVHRRGGRIGLVTQSGHQGRPLVQATELGVAFSRWVPTGNELDLEAADFVEYFAYDDDTAVIAGYFEGFRHPVTLRRALEAANARGKPVVALKMGSTQAGTRMAASHTGHLTGSDRVTTGLFRQHGVVRVRDLDELLETAALFAKLPGDSGPRCALYSISGGSGTLMAEVAEAAGVPVPELSAPTQKGLRQLIPDYLTVANPVDNGAQFLLSASTEDRRRVFRLLDADENVDVIVVGITGALGRITDVFAEDVGAMADELATPIVATWNSPKTDEPGFQALVDSGVVLFRSFRNCFSALADFAWYRRRAAHFRPRRPLPAELPEAAAQVLEEHARRAVGGVLPATEASRLLAAFGLPVAREELAVSSTEAARLAARLGYPVVMKVASPDFPHRSDHGLVRLGVADARTARAVFEELLAAATEAKPKARIEGVLVQEQVAGAVAEMIIGVSRDPVLGPAVLLGTGGVLAELFDDVAVCPLPLDRADVSDMLDSLRGRALLSGWRGRPRADRKALLDAVMAVARLATACGEDLAELDLNPVVVRSSGVLCVDSLVVMA